MSTATVHQQIINCCYYQ